MSNHFDNVNSDHSPEKQANGSITGHAEPNQWQTFTLPGGAAPLTASQQRLENERIRLMQDDYFREWYQLYSQGDLDPVAVDLAKREAAAQQAADEAGVQIILNLAMQKVDKLVPEGRPSALLDFVRNMAKSGAAKKLGETYRRIFEMGPVIDEGHGW